MYNVNVFKSNGTDLYIALKSSDISADSDCKIQFYKLTGSLFKINQFLSRIRGKMLFLQCKERSLLLTVIPVVLVIF